MSLALKVIFNPMIYRSSSHFQMEKEEIEFCFYIIILCKKKHNLENIFLYYVFLKRYLLVIGHKENYLFQKVVIIPNRYYVDHLMKNDAFQMIGYNKR